ncbi:hypothetical protein GEMRC1_004625 [Eukaryota sp. GEM-RC1]
MLVRLRYYLNSDEYAFIESVFNSDLLLTGQLDSSNFEPGDDGVNSDDCGWEEIITCSLAGLVKQSKTMIDGRLQIPPDTEQLQKVMLMFLDSLAKSSNERS